MKFVSELVFQSEPDADVITWLAECVTFRDGTRSFSIFNYEDVVDPNPVLRSFLLKLLLRCRKSGQVKEDIDKIIGQWALTDQYKLQTMVLLMDCLKVCDWLRFNFFFKLDVIHKIDIEKLV